MNVGRCVNNLPAMPLPGCCCFSLFCTSMNFSVLKTTEGILKLAEIILGSVCQNLLIGFGLPYWLLLGSSYHSFLITVCGSVFTSIVLLICYVVSNKSYRLIRQSIFEILFNGIASFFYISSSCFLAFAVNTFLYPVHKIISLFEVYPTMSVAYIVGLILGSIHGYDSWLAYKKYH